MYAEHFGLRELPFAITPDPRYMFMSERHREALAHLLYGAAEGGGFVQLTGEVGTGKTMLCRCLLEQLPPHVDVALILNPTVTSLELLAMACDELRVPFPPETAGTKALIDALSAYLLDAHARGRRTVLIIDEAQDLAVEVLEQIRLLTNLETAREKLLQIILIGQPELMKLLDREDLRQVAQRITARYHLTPFAEAETRAYIRHRLQVAGRSRGIFSDAAVREVHRHSGGIPRLINVLCDRALLGAFSQERTAVDSNLIERAAHEVSGRPPVSAWRARWRQLGLPAVAVLAAAAVGAALGLNLLAPRSPSPEPAGTLQPATMPVASTSTPGGTVSMASAEPRLATMLAAANGGSDRAAALAAVYARWGVDTGAAGRGCEEAHEAGFRCLTLPLGPGARGPDVAWVRGRLAALGGATGLTRTDVYDQDVRDRVMGFQRSRHLEPNGVIGEDTLLHLSIALPKAGVPLLSRPRS